MRIFTPLFLFLALALPCAANEGRATASYNAAPSADLNSVLSSNISAQFQTAMQLVAEEKLEAPEASRIYALLAIAHFNGYQAAHNQPLYKMKGSLLFQSAHSDKLVLACGEAMLRHLFPDSAPYPAPKSIPEAETIVAGVILALPKTAPVHQYSKAFQANLIHPEWARAPTLELKHANQYRAPAPPLFESENFQRALKNVRRYGEDVSEYRLSDDSLSAAFWGNPAGTMTPPGHWNEIALNAIQGQPIQRQLEILLTLNIALYDSGVAAWDTKYHYNFIRPDSYIQQTDPDNPKWKAMGDTPHHPEYVSGHSTFSAAAAEILTAFLGKRAFCAYSQSMWNLERCFQSYHDAARDAGKSRIYGGIHFDFSNEEGLSLGRKVAKNTLYQLIDKKIISNPYTASPNDK